MKFGDGYLTTLLLLGTHLENWDSWFFSEFCFTGVKSWMPGLDTAQILPDGSRATNGAGLHNLLPCLPQTCKGRKVWQRYMSNLANYKTSSTTTQQIAAGPTQCTKVTGGECQDEQVRDEGPSSAGRGPYKRCHVSRAWGISWKSEQPVKMDGANNLKARTSGRGSAKTVLPTSALQTNERDGEVKLGSFWRWLVPLLWQAAVDGGGTAARKAKRCVTSIKPTAERRGSTLPKICQMKAVLPKGLGGLGSRYHVKEKCLTKIYE